MKILPMRLLPPLLATKRSGSVRARCCTTACAWSARARPGLGISVPVRWDELASLKSGAHWTVSTVHTRLDQGNTPWNDYEKSRVALGAAMKKLGYPK